MAIQNKPKRKAKRSDVMDELAFIETSKDYYSVSQRHKASQLTSALRNTEWEPQEEIKRVIDILDGHHIDIPQYDRQKAGAR